MKGRVPPNKWPVSPYFCQNSANIQTLFSYFDMGLNAWASLYHHLFICTLANVKSKSVYLDCGGQNEVSSLPMGCLSGWPHWPSLHEELHDPEGRIKGISPLVTFFSSGEITMISQHRRYSPLLLQSSPWEQISEHLEHIKWKQIKNFSMFSHLEIILKLVNYPG